MRYRLTGHALQSGKAMDASVANYYAVRQLVSSGGLVTVNASMHGATGSQ
jgi:hypothetical protein